MSNNNGLNLDDLKMIGVKTAAETVLEQVLAEVRAGRITTVGIVAVPAMGGYAPVVGGHQIADLYMGLGSMQQMLRQHVENPNKSGIVRAAAAPSMPVPPRG